MSKSTRRTIADIEEECGFECDTREFRDYVKRHSIDIGNEKKRLKNETRFRRERRNDELRT